VNADECRQQQHGGDGPTSEVPSTDYSPMKRATHGDVPGQTESPPDALYLNTKIMHDLSEKHEYFCAKLFSRSCSAVCFVVY